ncbi:SDR family oxidoreductase [uncultured Shewanella sp.]|uniref:SDR family oxidoreductase n=1 Tax=uncultured Shewanella sp. TaxID=173975 RepID=UPI0026380778|nr:SDR family oxidoreductase [uncultured Shewanella sp.]
MVKVAVVTGASSGLGLHLSIMLAKQGVKTYATMRNLEKTQALLEEANNQGVDVGNTLIIKQLDVQLTSSVESCINSILAEAGKIDILVNNAGAGFIRTTEQATEEDIKWALDVNLLGVIRCTKAVLPIMREAKSGHILNISSVGGLVGQPFNEIYCAAKFAVEGYTESMASYIQPCFNVNFTLVEPGGIASEFANNALAQFQISGGMVDDEYKPILEQYIQGAQSRSADGVYQTSEAVAQVVLDCIAMASPPVRIRTSQWAEDFCQIKTAQDPDGKRQQREVIETFLSKN